MPNNFVRQQITSIESESSSGTYNSQEQLLLAIGSAFIAIIGFLLLNAIPGLAWYIYTLRYLSGFFLSCLGIFGFTLNVSALIVTKHPNFTVKLNETWYFAASFGWLIINPVLLFISLFCSLFAWPFFTLPMVISYFAINLVLTFLIANLQ
jgi:hypothetical protein